MNRWAYNAQNLFRLILAIALVAFRFSVSAQQPANRLNYLDGDDPFYVGLNFPKLTTPQWVGEKVFGNERGRGEGSRAPGVVRLQIGSSC